jgi:hypothetical protein
LVQAGHWSGSSLENDAFETSPITDRNGPALFVRRATPNTEAQGRRALPGQSMQRRTLMVLVLRTGTSDATDRGSGIFLDVEDDLDGPGLLEHQRALDLLAELEWLLEAEQQDAI